tara:strand:- start:63737 stop:65041 length:1305 start_codon:yes stop_codon:yes gene_type:complete
MKNPFVHTILLILFIGIYSTYGQDVEKSLPDFNTAYELAYEGKTNSAFTILNSLAKEPLSDNKTSILLASTLSWKGNFDKARLIFNRILSNEKNNREAWISAVKNELYAKNYAIALGLANKGLLSIENDTELERLKILAFEAIHTIEFESKGWYNVDSKVSSKLVNVQHNKKVATVEEDPSIRKTPVTEEKLKNRVAVNSSVTFFDQRFDPVTSNSISYKRQTKYGSIIPRLNNSNRVGINGIQLDLDLYPKIAKGFYAYVNYGYSESELFPDHKVGGDIYYNHKSGIEFSAGGRYISFATRDVKSITNSLGYYRGNYYFSLRSFITPSSNQLTKASGNILIRKYLKDAENYMGVNFGVGFSPELRQFTSGDQLLAETLLYIESQRLSFEYQFSSKNEISSYRTNIGVLRQEQSFDPGTFFYSFSAGLTYQFNF